MLLQKEEDRMFITGILKKRTEHYNFVQSNHLSVRWN